VSWRHDKLFVIGHGRMFVRCRSCGAQSPPGDHEALEAWWKLHTKLREKKRGTENEDHAVDPLG